MKKGTKRKLDDFFGQYERLNFKTGSVIIRPNEEITSIFLITSGFVRQYFISKEGEELTLHIFKPTSYFPLMLVLSGEENKYYFEAISEVIVLKAPCDEVLKFVKNNNDVLFELTTRFAKGIVGLTKRLEDLTSGNTYYKICALLVHLGKRMGKKTKSGVEIELNLTHRDLASWVGTTRETTSRHLEKLMKKKLIRFGKGEFIILNFKGLEKEAENLKKRGN